MRQTTRGHLGWWYATTHEGVSCDPGVTSGDLGVCDAHPIAAAFLKLSHPVPALSSPGTSPAAARLDGQQRRPRIRGRRRLGVDDERPGA